MHHTPSHMDDYLEAKDLDTASIYNIMADKHDSFPITVPFRKWAHQQVTITRSRRHYVTNHPLALKDIDIDWACMKSVAKQHRCMAAKAIDENHMGTICIISES